MWLRGDAGDPDRYPHELSGGQRQRVAIAIAVVLSPALLIADEPTTALDAHTREQVLAVLFDLVRSAGMGLLLITHDMSLIARTDRVAVLHRGRIVEQAATAELPDALRHTQARALIQAAQLEPRRTAGAAAGMGAAAAAPAAPEGPPRRSWSCATSCSTTRGGGARCCRRRPRCAPWTACR